MNDYEFLPRLPKDVKKYCILPYLSNFDKTLLKTTLGYYTLSENYTEIHFMNDILNHKNVEWCSIILKQLPLTNLDFKLKCTAYIGDMGLVEFFIDKDIKNGLANDWDWGMYGAALGGHKELVEFFIEKGANMWNRGMMYAAEGGHKELVDFFIEKGANTWNWGMHRAAIGGHQQLVEFFIEKCIENGLVSDLNGGIFYAKCGGHNELVDFFKQKIQTTK